MVHSSPALVRILGIGLGALPVLSLRAAFTVAGGSTGNAALLFAASLAGFGLGRMVPRGPTGGIAALGILGVTSLGAPELSIDLSVRAGHLLGMRPSADSLLLGLAAAALSAGFAHGHLDGRRGGLPPVDPMMGVLGALFAYFMPEGLCGITIAGLFIVGARQPVAAAPWPRRAPPFRGFQGELMGLTTLGIATSLSWTALHASLDPSLGTLESGFGVGAMAWVVGGALSKQGPRWLGPAVGAFCLIAGITVSFGVGGVRYWATQWIADPTANTFLGLPLLVIAGLAGLVGGSFGSNHPFRGAAFALGLILGGELGGPSALVPLAIGWAAASLLFSRDRVIQGLALVGVGAATFALFQLKQPNISELNAGLYAFLRDSQTYNEALSRRESEKVVWAQQSNLGSGVLRSSAANQTYRVELEGFAVAEGNRKEETEIFAIALARALQPSGDRLLVVGDDQGRLVRAAGELAWAETESLTPMPEVVRALALLDPTRRAAWLRPGTRLSPGHPALSLRASRDNAAIVEVIRAPWGDGVRAVPDPRHLAAGGRALRPDGTLIWVLHLDHFEAGEVSAVAAAFAERFPQVRAWLPPSGGDSLVLSGSNSRPNLKLFEGTWPMVSDLMQGLDLPNVATVASHAIADGPHLSAWQAEEGGDLPPPGLGKGITHKPHPHLAGLGRHVAKAGELWDLEGSSTGLAGLQSRLDLKQRYLELLAGSAGGDVKSVVEAARAIGLQDPGNPAVRGLIEPHIRNGRNALAKATQEGPQSKAWEEARRSAQLAQVLGPSSPDPYVLQGEIALIEGNLELSQRMFEDALGLDEGNLGALWGIARVARARKDPAGAEKALREAAQAHPREAHAWLNLGVFQMEQGNGALAEETLERALSLSSPTDPYPALALTDLKLRQGQGAAALVHAETAVARAKDQKAALGRAHYLRGRAWLVVERLAEAEADFQQAVILDPSLTAARGGYGELRARRGDLEGAIAAWRLVLQVEPGNVAARENIRRAEQAMQATERKSP
jgi:tetratricopeptide (TPR) repeat protein